jgi:hypothetical protein
MGRTNTGHAKSSKLQSQAKKHELIIITYVHITLFQINAEWMAAKGGQNTQFTARLIEKWKIRQEVRANSAFKN